MDDPLTPLERQQAIDRWRARVLGTPAQKDIPPDPGLDHGLDHADDEYGPIDQFVPLIVAFMAGTCFGIGVTALRMAFWR